jgi:hypothetical protein
MLIRSSFGVLSIVALATRCKILFAVGFQYFVRLT